MQSCWNFWASWGMNSQHFYDVTSLDRHQLISFKLFSAEKQTSKWEEQELTDHFFSCFEVFNWNFNFEKHLIVKNASISKIWSVRQERIKPLRDWKDYFKAWAAFINPLKIQLRRRRLYWEKKIRECDSAWMVLWKNIRSTCCTCVLVWVVITGIVVIIFSIITQPKPVHFWEGIPQMTSQGLNSHSSLFFVPYEG